MATSGKTVEQATTSLNRSKSYLKRKLEFAENAITLFQNSPTGQNEKEMRDAITKFKGQITLTEGHVDTLLEINPSVGEELDDYLDGVYESLSKLNANASAASASASTPAQAMAIPSHSSQYVGPLHIIDSMKPQILTADSSPMALRSWLSAFKSFYESCQLEKQPILVQQQQFKNFMELELQAHVAVKAMSDTPIFNDKGQANLLTCFKILEKRWSEKHPIHRRRVEFTFQKRPAGMSMSKFLDKFELESNELKIDEIDKDSFKAMVICNAINHRKLYDKLMLLEDTSKDPPGPPTMKQIEDCIRRFEKVRSRTPI